MTKTAVEVLLKPRHPAKGKVAYVYVIQDGDGHCKVGYSLRPNHRLSTLSSATPHGLVLAFKKAVPVEQARTVEQQAHEFLGPWKVAGEWFRVGCGFASAAVVAAAGGADRAMFRALADLEALLKDPEDDYDIDEAIRRTTRIEDHATEIERRRPGVLDQIDSFHSWWIDWAKLGRVKAPLTMGGL